MGLLDLIFGTGSNDDDYIDGDNNNNKNCNGTGGFLNLDSYRDNFKWTYGDEEESQEDLSANKFDDEYDDNDEEVDENSTWW